jgi:hypothetical protein
MNRKKLFPLLHSFYSFDAQVELLRHLPAVQIDLADRCRFIPALREMFSFHDSTPRSRIKAAAINKPAPIKITGPRFADGCHFHEWIIAGSMRLKVKEIKARN